MRIVPDYTTYAPTTISVCNAVCRHFWTVKRSRLDGNLAAGELTQAQVDLIKNRCPHAATLRPKLSVTLLLLTVQSHPGRARVPLVGAVRRSCLRQPSVRSFRTRFIKRACCLSKSHFCPHVQCNSVWTSGNCAGYSDPSCGSSDVGITVSQDYMAAGPVCLAGSCTPFVSSLLTDMEQSPLGLRKLLVGLRLQIYNAQQSIESTLPAGTGTAERHPTFKLLFFFGAASLSSAGRQLWGCIQAVDGTAGSTRRNADYLLYVAAKNSISPCTVNGAAGDTLAFAADCYQDQYDRPIAGQQRSNKSISSATAWLWLPVTARLGCQGMAG